MLKEGVGGLLSFVGSFLKAQFFKEVWSGFSFVDLYFVKYFVIDIGLVWGEWRRILLFLDLFFFCFCKRFFLFIGA